MVIYAKDQWSSNNYNNILLWTTRGGKTVNLLIRGQLGDSCVCILKGAAQCAPRVLPHLRTFDVQKSSTHVLTPPKLGALREVAPDNII